MTAIPGIVTKACNPFPSAPSLAKYEAYPDPRHSRWVTEILDRLNPQDIRNMARTLALLHPRDFEQELLYIEGSRRGA